MKHLKFKKIKVAKINHVNLILGGNNRQTIVQGCMPDTHLCPPKRSDDPNDTTCQTTNGGTIRTQGSFEETNECNG